MEKLRIGLWPFVLQIVAPICAGSLMVGAVYRLFAG
ncbi:hypothetical protein ABID65_007525 [Bradyrhizobium sp. S3.9.2]